MVTFHDWKDVRARVLKKFLETDALAAPYSIRRLAGGGFAIEIEIEIHEPAAVDLAGALR